ncbi:Nuclear control of ATPase protein 2 [Neolecta irregularis DAH-3]|uniref:Nuclear control of ATPase protein 2 n=1 Tax=Neolecta irregularis (strain DAH-3) TaxID=1198029 RepID=A0A1U7LPT2_NEOID|nr:Nuclear control of ATPase protein 2 [Neolecta irregularis DAH-3]|eukprot:OLL24676.1 Nuclear control of ATPase protein 2 [Neolecta irregularis DAH-3]
MSLVNMANQRLSFKFLPQIPLLPQPHQSLTTGSLADTALSHSLLAINSTLETCLTPNTIPLNAPLTSIKYLLDDISSLRGHDEKWSLLAKSALVVYARAVETLICVTVPLQDAEWYWEAVIRSPRNRLFYMLQTAPIRFFRFFQTLNPTSTFLSYFSTASVRQTFSSSILDSLSILDRIKLEADVNFRAVVDLKRSQAISIGILTSRCFTFEKAIKLDLASSIHQMRQVISRQDDSLSSNSDSKSYSSDSDSDECEHLATELINIITCLATFSQSTLHNARPFTKPSTLTRYWPAFLGLALSASKILHLLTHRQTAIKTWIAESFETITGFWYNWVIEPLNQIFHTLRQDSAITLTSQKSLASDVASLERMVLDFCSASGESAEVVRNAVRQGDLSAVLKVYESEMKSPVLNAVKGNLIRALLIQLQKTKVDVETAMDGIDRLLKSQELVFGLVGVAPGLLIVYGTASWIRGWGSGKPTRSEQILKRIFKKLRQVPDIYTN